jgi:hypothetical protein
VHTYIPYLRSRSLKTRPRQSLFFFLFFRVLFSSQRLSSSSASSRLSALPSSSHIARDLSLRCSTSCSKKPWAPLPPQPLLMADPARPNSFPAGLAGVLNSPDDNRDSAYGSIGGGSKREPLLGVLPRDGDSFTG